MRVVVVVAGGGALTAAVVAAIKKYKREAYAAYESVSGKKLEKDENGNFKNVTGNEVDAFRHAYVSAAVTRDFGRCIAYAGGEVNEIKGDIFDDQGKKHRNMDEWNNAEGRKIGLNTTTREEIKNAVWKALNDGVLIGNVDDDNPTYQQGNEGICVRIFEYLVYESWSEARDWVERRDPLALDLDGDGIETRGADGKVVFDHNNDGVKTDTGWLRPDDGWLVLDRNSNGTIDNGGELFGVDTVKSDGTKASDGFDALSDLDSNNDNIFDAGDTRFADVRVWRDLNQDGVSQSSELSTLAANNIRSISLNKTSATTNLGNGNAQTATATFTRTDDTTGTAANLGLVSNTFYRQFTKAVTLTDKAKKLPEASGSGAVRNLREAMSRYSTLNEFRLPLGSGNVRFIEGAKHTRGPAHE